MKTEIEARVLEIDVKDFIEKMKVNNAEFVGDWLQIRKCYDFTPAKPHSWIRLRTNGKETTLTIKEIEKTTIDGTQELEIVVSDFEKTDEILNKLGYTARSVQENRRIRYILDGVEVDIDFWPMIPAYVEFEAETEEQIKAIFEKLELDYEKKTTLDVASIYATYGIDINVLPDKVSLEEERKLAKYDI